MKTGSFITYSCKWISPKKIIFFASMSVEMATSGSPLWSRLEGRASSTWRRTMTGRRRRRNRRSGASGERRTSGNVNILTFFVDQLHRLGELHQFHRWHHLHQHWGFICVGFVNRVKKSCDLEEKGESRETNGELDEISSMEVLGEFHRIVSSCDRELENMLLPVTKLRYKPA